MPIGLGCWHQFSFTSSCVCLCVCASLSKLDTVLLLWLVQLPMLLDWWPDVVRLVGFVCNCWINQCQWRMGMPNDLAQFSPVGAMA